MAISRKLSEGTVCGSRRAQRSKSLLAMRSKADPKVRLICRSIPPLLRCHATASEAAHALQKLAGLVGKNGCVLVACGRQDFALGAVYRRCQIRMNLAGARQP